MKPIMFVLFFWCGLLLAGCGAEMETATAVSTALSTAVPIHVAVMATTAINTAVPTTSTQLLATDTAVPTSTIVPTSTVAPQPTLPPTNTPIPLPPPPGEIVFFWNPEPVDPTGPQPQNLYFIEPGNVAGQWEMETALTELHGADLFLSPDNTKFAIRRFEDTNEDGIISVQGTDYSNIYLYPLLDKVLTRLTDVEFKDFVEVSWLPNNQRFTYTLGTDVYLFDLENSISSKYLTLLGRIHDQQWSPDGRLLAIVSGLSDESGAAPGGESDRLDLYNVETNSLTSVVNKLGGSRIIWSPDSQWFAFSHDSSNQGLYVTSINNLMPIQLSSDLSFASWSPDGQWLAFTSQTGIGNLHLWNQTTLSTELLLEGNGRLSQPIWSPDGRYLAVALNGAEESNLLVIDVDDKTITTILNGPIPVPEPGPARWPLETLTWSPDGQWILFEASGAESRVYSIVDYSSGELFTVLDFTGTVAPENVYWLP